MKRLILITALLFSSFANAGIAKLNWSFDNRTATGQPITVTQFRIYYGAQGQPLSTVINLGPPAPLPWKITNGVGYYAKTLDRPEWVQGTTWCFQLSAIASSEESAKSNIICKLFPEDPNAPVLIDIVNP